MLPFLIRRVSHLIVILWLTSLVSFAIIQLPPGDYVSSLVAKLQLSGMQITELELQQLRQQYGLDKPLLVQYWTWVQGWFHGDFGYSFAYNKPVGELIAERLGLTLVVSLAATLLTYLIAIPVGVYSATHHYSFGDHVCTFFAFIGLAIPEFLIALVAMWFLYVHFGISIGGLFSTAFESAPWSSAKLVDMLKHLAVPIIVVGLSGTAVLIRIVRGMMLEELQKPYVVAVRARGLKEIRLILTYPLRLALLPLVSYIGWVLPALVSGMTIVSIVLNLPTVGALLPRALMSQDLYLAGSIIMFLTLLTVIGMLLSDILLAWLDPRIRSERQ